MYYYRALMHFHIILLSGVSIVLPPDQATRMQGFVMNVVILYHLFLKIALHHQNQDRYVFQ